MGREVDRIHITAHPESMAQLGPVLSDILLAARASDHSLAERSDLEPGVFEISDIVFAERPEA